MDEERKHKPFGRTSLEVPLPVSVLLSSVDRVKSFMVLLSGIGDGEPRARYARFFQSGPHCPQSGFIFFYKARRITTKGHQDPVAAFPSSWASSYRDSLLETVYLGCECHENDFTESFPQKLQATQSRPPPFTAWQRIPVLLPRLFCTNPEGKNE